MARGASGAATIQNSASGWYTDTGFTAGVTNINVGSSNFSGAVYHNWLAFNVAGLADQNITSATLTSTVGMETIPPPPARRWDFSIIPAASMR